MDLEVKEVSQLLNVPEAILLQWIKEGKMPAYYIQDRYRFNRAEIEDWVMQQTLVQEDDLPKDISKTLGQQQFNLYRAINKGEVFTDIKATTKLAVIKETTKRLASKLKLDADVLTDVIMEREQLAPTALGSGFGIPHARDFHLPGQSDVVAVVFLENPISYEALDGQPVHTLFFLLACDDKRHLSLLAKIAHLVKNQDMALELAKKPSKPELLEKVKNFEANLIK
jgi:nitrogen PTS system EIIA component